LFSKGGKVATGIVLKAGFFGKISGLLLGEVIKPLFGAIFGYAVGWASREDTSSCSLWL